MNTRNNPPDLIVITSYPAEGKTHGEGTVGVASYAKNTAVSMMKAAKKRSAPIRISVIAEKLNNQTEQIYKEQGVEVQRIWQRNHPLWAVQIIRAILPYYLTRRILIELEFAMFGNPLQLLWIPLLLVTLRAMGKDVTVVMHQVINDINDIAPHINIPKDSAISAMVNKAAGLFYKIVEAFTQKIIVFDEHLKKSLTKHINADSISVIVHGVERSGHRLSQRAARATLGYKKDEFVILCFGFLAWYKGTDWIIKTIQTLAPRIGGKRIKLVMAGGANPNHLGKPYYEQYLEKIYAIVRGSRGRIQNTGFLTEEKIRPYFVASDLVLFPYRILMSASGPFAMALSYGKPFLVSKPMIPMLETADVAQLLGKQGINQTDISFALAPLSLKKALTHVIGDRTIKSRITKTAQSLGTIRNFRYIGDAYYTQLFIRPLAAQTFLTWKQEAAQEYSTNTTT